MAITYDPANVNVALNGQYDKVGDAFFRLKNVLAAGGRWRVKASGDGGALVQNRGQTAGLGGVAPWDVLTAAIAGTSGNFATGAAGSFSRIRAWYIMEELDAVGGNPTGRAFCVKRSHTTGNDSGYQYAIGWVKTNFANTGATATTPPAPVSGVPLWIAGSSFNDGGASGLTPKTGLSTYGETNQAFINMTTESASNNWLHIGVETAPATDNVVGFQLNTFCRSDGQTGFGFYYRALSRAVGANPHPAVVALGSWPRIHGNQGVVNSTLGPFQGASLVWDLNGGGLVRFSQRANGYIGGGVASQVGLPSSAVQPARSDGTFLTQPIEVMDSAGAQLGLLRNCYANPVNRAYNTTYGVVAPNTPRITWGQMISEWVNGIAPGFTP